MSSSENISFKDLTTNERAEQTDTALGCVTMGLDKDGCPSDIIARKCFEYGFLFAEPDDVHDPVKVTTWMAIIDEVYERAKALRTRFEEAFAEESH